MDFGAAVWLAFDHVESRIQGSREHGNRRRRKNERARPVDHHVSERARSGNPRAARTERLAAGVDRCGHTIAQSQLFHATGTTFAVKSRGMCLVDDEHRITRIRQLGHFLERSRIPSIRLAWLRSSEKMTSRGVAIACIRPTLAA